MKENMLKKYKQHKGSVCNRFDRTGQEIKFLLSFEEWSKIWLESEKWENRGRGRGKYCMSRINDLGHYEVGNVYIQLIEDNTRERNRLQGNMHSSETIEKIRDARKKQAIPKGKDNKKSKPIITPDGKFDSIRIAGEYYKCTPEAIGWRIKNKEGYEYVK